MGKFTSPPKNYVTPPKESVGKHLRKIAVLRSKKKFKKAKSVASSLKSKFKVAEIAALTGEKIQAVYRLLSPEVKQRTQAKYVKILTQEDKNEVICIHYDDEVSYSLPDMKYSGLRFMHFTLREAYAVYVRKCWHNRIVADKTFEILKPRNIRTVQETPLRGARCEYFTNFGKSRDALIAYGMKGIPCNHAESIEVTWCPFRKDSQDITSHFQNGSSDEVTSCFQNGTSDEVTSRLKNGTSDEVTSHLKNGTSDEVTSRLKNVTCEVTSCLKNNTCEVTSCLKKVQHDLPKKKSVLRKCPMCGVTKYEQDLIQNNRFQMRTQKEVTWRQWEQIKIGDKKGKAKYRTELRMKTGSIINLMKLYTQQLQSMSLHQFFKVWQLPNFNLTINNLQRGQVLFVHDFQQNLLLVTQDESSGSYWDHPQLTIHPTAVYYHCSRCDELVKEDIIHITMDKSHDKHGVNQFIATTIDHLKKKDMTINEIIEFTDHASSQYKSRFTFYYMMLFDVPCTRHYFGVKHGKGPSDRAGANFKLKVRSAVRAGKILLSTDAIAEYCRENFELQIGCGSDERDVNEHDINKRDVNERDINKRDVNERDVNKKQNLHSLFKVNHHRTILQPKKEMKLKQLKGSRDYLQCHSQHRN